MKSKSTSKQQQTNTYGHIQTPITAQQQAFDDHIKTAYDQADPNIPYQFNNAREALNNRFDNPFGADISPEVRDAVKYEQGNFIDQAQGQAAREDSFNRKQAKTGALATSAGMVAPQLVQTGGSSIGSGTQTTPLGPALIGAVGQIGGGYMS